MDNKDNPQIQYTFFKKLQLLWYIVWRALFIVGYLLLVAFILLVGLVIFFVPPTCTKGSEGPGLKLKKDSQELQIALEQYADRYGNLPSEEQGIMALVEMPTLPPIPKNYKPILNKKSAVLDPWHTPYVLTILANGDYAIITLGKDKKEGGEGKNADFNIMKEDEYPKEFQKGN
ncbi:MAG: type II secretion system protein GspG [Leptospiraceae bacterium]|nr:type II secretion system protein GspG [Leptospiraceae bacterium]MBK7056364.1 type II secretion system protein GspG [Leptospiraceae bacterium]MBK9503777.1 type II secretion system protein GspG [Leptospiraceae bacterium]